MYALGGSTCVCTCGKAGRRADAGGCGAAAKRQQEQPTVNRWQYAHPPALGGPLPPPPGPHTTTTTTLTSCRLRHAPQRLVVPPVARLQQLRAQQVARVGGQGHANLQREGAEGGAVGGDRTGALQPVHACQAAAGAEHLAVLG